MPSFACGQTAANGGTGYVKLQCFQAMDARAGGNAIAVAGAREDDELHLLQHVAPTKPGFDFTERVGADEEEKLGVRPEFSALDLTQTDQKKRRELAKYYIQRRRGDVSKWMDGDTPFPAREAAELDNLGRLLKGRVGDQGI